MYQLINKTCHKACKLLDPDKTNKLVKKLAYRLKNRKRFEKQKEKVKQKKIDRKNQRIALFGKRRYYLSELFGQWVLYI